MSPLHLTPIFLVIALTLFGSQLTNGEIYSTEVNDTDYDELIINDQVSRRNTFRNTGELTPQQKAEFSRMPISPRRRYRTQLGQPWFYEVLTRMNQTRLVASCATDIINMLAGSKDKFSSDCCHSRKFVYCVEREKLDLEPIPETSGDDNDPADPMDSAFAKSSTESGEASRDGGKMIILNKERDSFIPSYRTKQIIRVSACTRDLIYMIQGFKSQASVDCCGERTMEQCFMPGASDQDYSGEPNDPFTHPPLYLLFPPDLRPKFNYARRFHIGNPSLPELSVDRLKSRAIRPNRVKKILKPEFESDEENIDSDSL